MENLIDQIFDVIGDYRSDEGNFISKERIENWINQFVEEDREFLLEELLYIFRKRYISKSRAKEIVKEMLQYLADKNANGNVIEFLSNTEFIDGQKEGKSQKYLLVFLDDILKHDYNFSLEQCGAVSHSFCIYLDDILCTGDTVYKSLTSDEGWLQKKQLDGRTNLNHVVDGTSKLFFAYFAIHKLNFQKVAFRIGKSAGKSFNIGGASLDEYTVDNNYVNPNGSALDFIYPVEVTDEDITACKEHISEKVKEYSDERGYKISQPYFFRPSHLPKNEVLFTSVENRNRFESIILKKSIEVYNAADNSNKRMRPLGYGLAGDVSFGFGTLLFTWRNVAFNTPMVFWYGHRGFVALFERNFTTYNPVFNLGIEGLF